MAHQRSEFVSSRLTVVAPSLHRGREHMGFNGVGNGKGKNFVESRNSYIEVCYIQIYL